MKHKQRSGNSYIPPGPLSKRQGFINPKVNKNCFHYAALIGLYASEIKSETGKNYFEATGYEKQILKRKLENGATWAEYIDRKPLQFSDLKYGDDFTNLPLFEKTNSVSCTVWKFSKKENQVVAIRTTKIQSDRHINLLLLCRSHLQRNTRKRYKSFMHWAVILNESAFFRVKKWGYSGICRYCGSLYRNKQHEILFD